MRRAGRRGARRCSGRTATSRSTSTAGSPRPRPAAAAAARAAAAAVRRGAGAARATRGPGAARAPTHPIPIATGERLYSRWDFLPVLQAGVAVVQPDLVARRRHLRGAPDRRAGRDLRRRAGAALPARPDRARRLPAGRLRDAELPDPGAEAGHPLQPRRRPARLPRRPGGVRLSRRLRRAPRPRPGSASRSTRTRCGRPTPPATPGASRSGGTPTAPSPSGEGAGPKRTMEERNDAQQEDTAMTISDSIRSWPVDTGIDTAPILHDLYADGITAQKGAFCARVGRPVREDVGPRSTRPARRERGGRPRPEPLLRRDAPGGSCAASSTSSTTRGCARSARPCSGRTTRSSRSASTSRSRARRTSRGTATSRSPAETTRRAAADLARLQPDDGRHDRGDGPVRDRPGTQFDDQPRVRPRDVPAAVVLPALRGARGRASTRKRGRHLGPLGADDPPRHGQPLRVSRGPVLVLGVDAPGAGNGEHHDMAVTHGLLRCAAGAGAPAPALPGRRRAHADHAEARHRGAGDGRGVVTAAPVGPKSLA